MMVQETGRFAWRGVTANKTRSALTTLGILIGVAAVIILVAVGTGIARTKDSPRWWTFLVEGLISIAAGVVALIWPGLATLVLLYVIASWAIFTGILEIVTAIRLRHEITNEWMLGLGGLLSVLLGVLIFFQPAAGSLAIVWTIASYAVLFGILLIVLGFRLRSWKAPDSPQAISSVR